MLSDEDLVLFIVRCLLGRSNFAGSSREQDSYCANGTGTDSDVAGSESRHA